MDRPVSSLRTLLGSVLGRCRSALECTAFWAGAVLALAYPPLLVGGSFGYVSSSLTLGVVGAHACLLVLGHHHEPTVARERV